MKVLYILNESSFYMQMAWISLNTLRIYNKSIPIEILFIKDKLKDSRYIGELEKHNLGVQKFDFNSFQESCQNMGINFHIVNDLDMKEEKGFHPLQRMAFSKVKDDKILLLDADTFIMGDVEPLFESLKSHDIVADLNLWGQWGGKLPYKNDLLPAFNSGVVLFNNGLLNLYGNQVYDYSMMIKGEESQIGQWFSQQQKREGSKDKLGREEAAFSLFVYDNKINYRLSKSEEIQTNDLKFKTLIHHTQVQNYLKYWYKYFRTGRYDPFF